MKNTQIDSTPNMSISAHLHGYSGSWQPRASFNPPEKQACKSLTRALLSRSQPRPTDYRSRCDHVSSIAPCRASAESDKLETANVAMVLLDNLPFEAMFMTPTGFRLPPVVSSLIVRRSLSIVHLVHLVNRHAILQNTPRVLYTSLCAHRSVPWEFLFTHLSCCSLVEHHRPTGSPSCLILRPYQLPRHNLQIFCCIHCTCTYHRLFRILSCASLRFNLFSPVRDINYPLLLASLQIHRTNSETRKMAYLGYTLLLFMLTLVVGFLPSAHAHSWVEQITIIAPNGSFVGAPGYARGNVLRTSPGFSDPTMVNLIPPNGRPAGNQILPTDPICKNTQMTPNQTPGSPALQAAAGSLLALRYQENGHVTLPQNTPGKPANRGTVYVYGTTQPSPNDSLLGIHKVWTADGSGGDKRGKLVATQNFDDSQCYQVNGGNISIARQAEFKHVANPVSGADIWCQTDMVLPQDARKGQPYTLYWVWDWPTLPSADAPQGKNETYTTCMDIDITNDAPAPGPYQFVTQNFGTSAVASLMQQANQPSLAFNPSSPSGGSSSSSSALSSSAPSANTQTPASPTAGIAPLLSENANGTFGVDAPQAPTATTTVYVTLPAGATTAPTAASPPRKRSASAAKLHNHGSAKFRLAKSGHHA